MSEDKPYLALDGVSLAFGQRQVLENVSLQLHPGEIVTLIGPNGAGKTTLLRVALGLEKPDTGSVRLKPGLRLGYLPQRLKVDDTMPLTVRRFLSLAPNPQRSGAEALGETGAGHVLDLPVQTLSGGELQRVLLARALMRDPDLLVLDEPVQGVDVAGQAEIFALIRRIRDTRQTAILLVSHDLHLVMAKTDKVICLNRHVCCSGHPDEVMRDPAYRALFGEAADAFALYTHHHDHGHDHAHDRGSGHPHG
jgi:zinc transport system ATP-binding protein